MTDPLSVVDPLKLSVKVRPVPSSVPAVLSSVVLYLIVSPGSALVSPSTSPPTGKVAVMVAVKLPTGGGNGCGNGGGAGAVGGLTNGAGSEELLVFASLFVEARGPSVAVGVMTPLGAAMAVKGVIRIAKDRRQVTKTRRLPAAGSGDNCFTT